MPEPIPCPECGHDITKVGRALREIACFEPVPQEGSKWHKMCRCPMTIIGIARAYADMQVRKALEAGPTEVEIEAAAEALNIEGWTCYGGAHEPGHYNTCPDCKHNCYETARVALRAAVAARTTDHERRSA